MVQCMKIMWNTMEGKYIDMFAKEQFQKFHICVQLVSLTRWQNIHMF
jgi:hypothetical protein